MVSGHCCECPTDAGGEVEVTGTASLQDSSILIIFWTQKSHAPDQAGCQDRHHRLEWHDTWHRKLEVSLDFGVLDKTRTLTANALWKGKGRLFDFHFGSNLIQQRVPGSCYVLESFAEIPFLLKKLVSKTWSMYRQCNVDFTLPYSPLHSDCIVSRLHWTATLKSVLIDGFNGIHVSSNLFVPKRGIISAS